MKNKEIAYIFRGHLKEYCQLYVDYKRGIGFKMGASVYYLLRGMDDFFSENVPLPSDLILTKEMVEAYVARRGAESIKTQHMRMTLVRQFALFMNRIEFDFYVYPKADFVKVKSNFIPYIFTHSEIKRLTNVLDRIPVNPWHPTYHLVYPMLFRMLYGCGLRINEALGLKMSNINMDNGIIMLESTKNQTQRLIPMSQSLYEYCKKYIKHMKFSTSYDGYYYPTRNGSEYNSTPVYCQFRKFMSKTEIFRDNGTTPRVHDIRHTFAVHALEKMIKEGKDIYCSLPVLSTYLGHRGIESTERYLRLTMENYSYVIDTMNEFYQEVFPEVTDYED